MRIAPVTFDVEYGDSGAVVLDSDRTLVGTPATVWLNLIVDLPLRALDRDAGGIFGLPSGHGPDDLESTVRRLGRRGRTVVSPADPVVEYRAHLQDRIDTLAAPPATLAGDGTLKEMLRAANLTVAAIAAIADVSDAHAFALRRGTAPLTFDEAARLAPVMHSTPADLVAANPAPPDELFARLEQPWRRPDVEALAQRRNVSLDAAYDIAGFGTAALAARTSGDETDPAWDERLDRYLQSVLDD